MRKWKSMLLCCLVLSCFVSIGLAETIVIDFDDYDGPLMPIPAGYAGFTSWGSFGYTSTAQPPVYIPYSGYDGLVDEVKVLYAAGTNTWSMDDFTYDTEMVAVEGATWRALKDLYR